MLCREAAHLETDDLPNLPLRQSASVKTALGTRLSLQRSQHRAVAV